MSQEYQDGEIRHLTPDETAPFFGAAFGIGNAFCDCCLKAERCMEISIPRASNDGGRLNVRRGKVNMCLACANTLMNLMVRAVTNDPDQLRIRADGKDGDI